MNDIITRQDLIPLRTYRQGRDEYIKKMICYIRALRKLS